MNSRKEVATGFYRILKVSELLYGEEVKKTTEMADAAAWWAFFASFDTFIFRLFVFIITNMYMLVTKLE
jgi:hypothetical protein